MPNLLQEIYKKRKLLAVLAVAGVIVLPVAAQALTTDEKPLLIETEQTQTTEEEPVGELTEEVTTEEITKEVVVVEETTDETTEEVVEEEVAPEEVTGAVNVVEAATIAQAAHPESTISDTKAKTIGDVIVFVYFFEDGWKVYVNAYDGTVYKVVDASEKDCGGNHKTWTREEGDRNNATTSSYRASDSDDSSRSWSRNHRSHR